MRSTTVFLAIVALPVTSCDTSVSSASVANSRSAERAPETREAGHKAGRRGIGARHVPGTGLRPRRELAGPRRFVGESHHPELLESIRAGMTAEIDFAGHYSTAVISCGTACVTYFFVDRNSGDVIAYDDDAETSARMIWDIRTRRDSDILTVLYGDRDDTGAPCSSRAFRWTGSGFERLGDFRPAPCPR
jgi:hypothetical protein